MKLLSEKELNNLNTKRLLAYRNSLLRCLDHKHWDYPTFATKTLTKDSAEWKEQYFLLKLILGKREHVGN